MNNRLLLYAIPLLSSLAGGVAVLWLIAKYFHAVSIPLKFFEASFNFGAIMAGFVVSQMIFTGRVAGVEHLELDQARDYRSRVQWLMTLQMFALRLFMIIAAIGFSRMLFPEQITSNLIEGIFTVLGGTLLILFLFALYQVVFKIPEQIQELQGFSLNALVEQKIKEAQEVSRKINESIRQQ